MNGWLALAALLEGQLPPQYGMDRVLEMPFDKDTTVEDACGVFGYQAWRVADLLQNEVAYTIDPATGERTTALTPSSIVPAGHKFHVPYPDEPKRDETIDAWKAKANANSVDYAYLKSGAGSYYDRSEIFFNRRSDTVLFKQSGRFAEYFMMRLNGRTADEGDTFKVEKPIRAVLLGAHATSGGFLYLSPNVNDRGIHYNDLVGTQFNWALQPFSLEPRPTIGNSVVPSRLEIFGCNIGRAAPFLKEFRRAMNVSEVIAPKFFVYVFDTIGNPALSSGVDAVGYYFLHDWRVTRPNKIATKTELISAFTGANFKDFQDNPPSSFSGNQLTRPDWEAIFSSLSEVNLNKRPIGNGQYVEPQLGELCTSTLASGVLEVSPGQNIACEIYYRYVHEQLPPQLKSQYVLPSDPGTGRFLREDAAMNVLESISYLHDANFPLHQRWGHATRNEFRDSWNWDFKKIGSKVHFNPTRHAYTFMYPLIDHAAGAHRIIATVLSGLGDKTVLADTVPKIGGLNYDRIFERVT